MSQQAAIPKSMRAIAIEGGVGPARSLKLSSIETPTPKSSEVLIRVAAAGVNYPDIIQREGRYPLPPGTPETLGLEISGTVASVGADVQRFRVGDQVCALLLGGGYAEYAAVDARHVLPVPAGVDVLEAAAVPETFFTVYANVFERGALKSGETLLVHGGTSGIGTTAISMAKAAGARVFATSRSAEKARQAKMLGADVSIDSSRQDFVEVVQGEGGVDVILDMVGGEFVRKNLDVLKPDGRLSQIAFLSGSEVTLNLQQILFKRLTFTGSLLRARSADDKARLAGEIEERVWPWFASGSVGVRLDRVFPLADAAAAHAYIESGGHLGKVVLQVEET
jgi:NADPH2:quinone reductase